MYYHLNKDMLLQCIFGAQQCSSEDFTLIYHFEFFNCYMFNSGKDNRGNSVPLKYISQRDSDNGFLLEMIVGAPYYVNPYKETSSGVAIFMSDVKEYSFTNSYTSAPTGMRTRLKINKVVNKRLGQPHSNCTTGKMDDFDSEIYRLTILQNYTYSQDFCLNLCYQHNCISKCNCYDPRFPSLGFVHQCLNEDELYCGLTAFTKFLSNHFEEL